MNFDNTSSSSKTRKRNAEETHDLEEALSFTSLYKQTLKSRDDTEKEDKPTPNCINNARCYFCEFCDNTSIHGFKFLGERGRYIIEKIWWFCVVTFAISGSGILIYNTYVKWSLAPVIVTFATTETPIWKIPFPAVTICPELKVDKAVFNYSDVFSRIIYQKNVTQKEIDGFSFLHMICDDFGLEIKDYLDFNRTKNVIDVNEIWDYLITLDSPKPLDCKWMGKNRECDDILRTIFTPEGACTTFNALDADDMYKIPGQQYQRDKHHVNIKKWSLEEGYPPNSDLDTFPYRTILVGSKAGFQIDLNVKEYDIDYGCGELQGFKVALHHPAEEPNMDKHFRVPLDEAVFVGIRPKMMTTAGDIASYKPQERHCYVPGEKELKAFNIYTQQNCMSECLTNYTIKMCGCVGFHMACKNVTFKCMYKTSWLYFCVADYGNVDFCSLGKKECMNQAKLSFLQNDINFMKNGSAEDNEADIFEQCDCLPGCTSIEFEAETSQNKNDWKRSIKSVFNEDDVPIDLNKERFSRLIVYYKDMQFMTSERHELYGTIDFLANCGGLLGLFCGFSFTSSMEILYYLTLRLVCNIKKFGQKVWSGAPESIK